MISVTVLPELMAMGPSFKLEGGLVVHLHSPLEDPGKLDIQLEAPAGGDWGFLKHWSKNDPGALEEWSCQLVQSLNRWAAEGLESVSVQMPLRGSRGTELLRG